MKKSRIITLCLAALVCVGCYDLDAELTEDEIKMESLINRTNEQLDICGFHGNEAIEIPEIRIESCHRYIKEIICNDDTEVVYPAGCANII